MDVSDVSTDGNVVAVVAVGGFAEHGLSSQDISVPAPSSFTEQSSVVQQVVQVEPAAEEGGQVVQPGDEEGGQVVQVEPADEDSLPVAIQQPPTTLVTASTGTQPTCTGSEVFVTSVDATNDSTKLSEGLKEEVADSTMDDQSAADHAAATAQPARKGKKRGRPRKGDAMPTTADEVLQDADAAPTAGLQQPSPRKTSLRNGGSKEPHCELELGKCARQKKEIWTPPGDGKRVKPEDRSAASAALVTDDSLEASRPPKCSSMQQVMDKTVNASQSGKKATSQKKRARRKL